MALARAKVDWPFSSTSAGADVELPWFFPDYSVSPGLVAGRPFVFAYFLLLRSPRGVQKKS